MSKRRTVVSLIAILCVLPLVIGLAAWRFPLTAQAQGVADEAGVLVQTGGWSVLHRAGVLYPAEARQKGVSGTVTVAVTTDEKGEVTDAKVTGGPEELRKPVLQSVLSWHFAVPSAQSFQVAVRFDAPAGVQTAAPIAAPAYKSVTVERLDFNALPLALRDRVTQAGLIHEGDVVTQERFVEISRSLAAIDSHLRMAGPLRGDKVTMRVFLQPDRTAPVPLQSAPATIRVGGNVQAANLLEQVNPGYPPVAKAARIQGTVRFDVIIGKDGHVENLTLQSGHPLLIQAAQEAVQQWIYKPTLLNGQPVSVATVVDVNFTLAQ